MLDEVPIRSAMALSVSAKPCENATGSLAAKKPPRPLTDACNRSSILPGSVLVLGQLTVAPLLIALKAVVGLTEPCTPKPTPKVTICCQNAGLAAEVGTVFSIFLEADQP